MNLTSRLQELVLADWTFWSSEGQLRYRAPKAGATAEILNELREQRAEILRLLEQTPEVFDVGPLSYGQRALWFLWAVAPWGVHYNQSILLRVGGAPDGLAWREACRRLVARHAILRTVFPRLTQGPLQQIRRSGDIDWQATSATAGCDDQIRTALAAAHAEPFDLEAAPPVRFRWFGRDSNENLLLITMHHIVCDGWSLELIRRELPPLLPGSAGEPPLPLATYFDFVKWQRDMLSGPDGVRLRSFWSEQLSEGRLPTLDLPTDRPRPTLPTYRGGSCPLVIPAPLSTRLRAISREEGVTLFTVLMAGFFAWLNQVAGQDDLVVGTPTAGRDQREFMSVVGYFVEPVAVRMRIDPERGFRSLLREVRETVLRAIEHRDMPFALLVETLQPARDPSRSPVFDVLFNFLSQSSAAPDDRLNALDGPQADGKFDLTLTILEQDDVLTGALGYSADLFEESTVQRFATQFVARLEDVVTDPDAPLRQIRQPEATAECLVPILVGRPLDDPDRLRPVHERFERQAVTTPDHVAVIAGAARITYGELNRLANGLARRLLDLGAGRDVTVAIHAERSVEFVVAVLAALKAGAGFVPLDPSLPQGLLEDMARRASATIVLARPTSRGCFERLGIPVLNLADVFDATESRDGSPLQVAVAPGDLAYVIYTSGSTGRPKGVAIEHRSLSLYVSSIVRDLALQPGASFAMVSSPAADLGHTALFPALCTGGQLHLLPESVVLDGHEFADYLRSHEIDYLKIVPSHLAALVAAAGGAPALPRKALILGGESSSTRWVRSLQALVPGCAIINHYGPTETTVGVLTARLEPGCDPGSTPNLLLHEPVAGAVIYLLDQALLPVPPGSIGELYIGGDCVARGYVQDRDLTRKSFITGFGGDSVRLYKTGDLARQRDGGGLEILGRADRQIKVRGHRVDPAHVEAVIERLDAVRQCVVLPDVSGDKATSLRAFVVVEGGPGEPADRDARADTLREQLLDRLPPAMVPAELHILDQLPLTPNGKVDMELLARRPIPTRSEASRDNDRGSARDLVELDLCRIWREVLGKDDIGLNDDFFELGGHSLLAVRLVGRIHEEFGRRIPLATLLTHRSIDKLARVLRSTLGGSPPPSLVPLNRGRSEPPVLFLPGAGGSILYLQDLARLLEPEHRAVGLPGPGIEPSAMMPTRIVDIARHHIEAIRNEGPRGPYFLVGHSLGGLVAFEMARQWIARGEDVAFVGVIDNPAPTDPNDISETDPDRTHADWLRHVAVRMERLYRIDLHLRSDEFDLPDEDQQTIRLANRLLALNLLPPGVDPSFFVQFIKVYKSNAIAAANYRPVTLPLSIPVTLFRSEEDDPTLGRAAASDLAMGWGRLTTLPVNVHFIPGTHITSLTRPHVLVSARKLRECLVEAHTRVAQESNRK